MGCYGEGVPGTMPKISQKWPSLFASVRSDAMCDNLHRQLQDRASGWLLSLQHSISTTLDQTWPLHIETL